ncbi:hypothetical protein DBV15_01772 [Temnothorax longispinosus]|uniref:Uncharacterized protein n=1 Tax=Temnothorax longispinosus TaxID=300112 RepID=A0A4S2KRU3_9HYME|nr:hypothetical protein DBV15_01769 [Temnothorax longispinosus]TGZ50809.1 hypothetical protein DBV15_01772 [Temnothorax longispinosus]
MFRNLSSYTFPPFLTVSPFFLSHHKLRTAQREWQIDQELNLRQLLRTAAERAIAEQPENQDLKYVLKSTAERQLDYGLIVPLINNLLPIFQHIAIKISIREIILSLNSLRCNKRILKWALKTYLYLLLAKYINIHVDI